MNLETVIFGFFVLLTPEHRHGWSRLVARDVPPSLSLQEARERI
jgi:hypothetical protein